MPGSGCFTSVFGVLFLIAPRLLLSFFWSDEEPEDGQTEAAQPENVRMVLGFRLLNMSDLERWWARCIGATILSLNLGVAVDANISQPLYTAGSLVTVSTLTLLNFHQVLIINLIIERGGKFKCIENDKI